VEGWRGEILAYVAFSPRAAAIARYYPPRSKLAQLAGTLKHLLSTDKHRAGLPGVQQIRKRIVIREVDL